MCVCSEDMSSVCVCVVRRCVVCVCVCEVSGCVACVCSETRCRVCGCVYLVCASDIVTVMCVKGGFSHDFQTCHNVHMYVMPLIWDLS